MSVAVAAGAPLHQFQTRLMTTSVYADRDAHRWVREPGPAYPGSGLVPAADLIAGVHPVLRTPVVRDGVFHYAAAGRLSAAVLLAFGPGRDGGILPQAFRSVGQALAALHRRSAPATVTAGHPGPQRLAAWWHGTAANPRLHRLRAAAGHRLGEARVTRLLDDLGTATAGGGTLLHGAATLALVVPAPRGQTVLLSGESPARGPGWLDVGWLAAELREVELAGRYGLAPAMCRDYRPLHAALAAGYGAALEEPTLTLLTAVRVLTHAHDFAAYLTWDDQLHRYLDIAADLLG